MATPSTLLLRLAEDFYLEDARFRVSVDGVTLGNGTVTARRGSEQAFTFTGDLGTGPRVVTIDFLNDAYGGTDATDRNLIVEGISLDGVAVPGAPTILFGSGPRDFAIPATAPPDVLTLRLAEDYYLADAQFAVSVDGVRVGTGTVTARRGSEQAFTFTGSFGDGPHVVTLDFLNDAYGGTDANDRNLIVEGISFNGVAVPSSTAILFGSGPRDFAVPAGSDDAFVPVRLSDVALGIGGYKISGATANRALAGPGDTLDGGQDVNGDGRPDVALADGGGAWVAFGRADGANVDLAEVARAGGGFFVGRSSSFGFTTGLAGDANGDGRADLLVGTATVGSIGAYVVPGKADWAPVDLSAGGSGAFYALSNQDSAGRSRFGAAFSGIGDLNGDGLADFLVGAPGAGADPPGGQSSGRAYVFYGSADGGNTTPAIVIAGNTTPDTRGSSIGGALAGPGDVNGDGRPDLLLGDNGFTQVVFGNPSATAVDLADIRAGIGGFRVVAEGTAPSVNRVSALGDLNGDGRADFLVGVPDHAPLATPGDTRGAVYAVYGKADGAELRLSDVAAGVGGFKILGPSTGGRLGEVAGVGDANGDGRPDILVGASGADVGAANNGAAFLVFGRTDGATVDLDAVLAGTSRAGVAILGEADGDNAGATVSAAGDVNGDSLADLLVGAPGNDALGRTDAGAAYVVYGRADWFA